MSAAFFDPEFQAKVDRFALDVVKEYRRYVNGEGDATDEAGKLFGCSVFAHYLAKCAHYQKKLAEKGIPGEPNACQKPRNHFFLCSGSALCNDLSDNLIKCVQKEGVTTTDEMQSLCTLQYEAFRACYINKIATTYADENTSTKTANKE